MNPYSHPPMSQPLPGKHGKEGTTGKGKSKKGSQKKQAMPSSSMALMQSDVQMPAQVNYLDRPMDGPMSPHLDPHAPLSSGMHSLGSTMHMMQAPGPYDPMAQGMPGNVPPQGGYPDPKLAGQAYMHKQPGMRM